MKATIQKLARIALVFGIGSCLMATTSLAQKSGGSATGGGTGGGGTGGGGGGGVTTTTVIVPMFGTYYGVGGSGSTVATGSVTLTF